MKILKTAGIALGVLAGLAAVVLGYFYVKGGQIAGKTYPVAQHHTQFLPDSSYLEHGKHISQILGCQECHGENLAGKILVDAPPFFVAPSNLTSGAGGIMSGYDDQQLEILIRHGVKNTGKAVFFMPSFNPINDYDFSALAAYLRSLSPVDNVMKTSQLRPLGQVLTGAGLFPYDMNVNLKNADHPDFVTRAPDPNFGQYLSILTCEHCHGSDLRGGKHPEPGAPPAPSLEASVYWNSAHFANAIRKGITPEGRQLNGRYMPWPSFSGFTDVEILALKMYIDTRFRQQQGVSGRP